MIIEGLCYLSDYQLFRSDFVLEIIHYEYIHSYNETHNKLIHVAILMHMFFSRENRCLDNQLICSYL